MPSSCFLRSWSSEISCDAILFKLWWMIHQANNKVSWSDEGQHTLFVMITYLLDSSIPASLLLHVMCWGGFLLCAKIGVILWKQFCMGIKDVRKPKPWLFLESQFWSSRFSSFRRSKADAAPVWKPEASGCPEERRGEDPKTKNKNKTWNDIDVEFEIIRWWSTTTEG